MAALAVSEPIPDEMAIKLCDQVCADNRGKWYTFRGLWCWGCRTFSKGDATKRCYASKDGNRGCPQMNERWDTLVTQWGGKRRNRRLV